MRHRTGTVVFRDGAWWARVQYIDNGKRKEIRRRPRPFNLNTKQRARDLLDELLRQFDTVSRPDVTLAQACEEFIASSCVPPIYENGQKIRGMSDHKDCRRFLETVAASPLGAKHMSDVTYVDLRALRDARLEAPKRRGGKTVVETKGRRRINSTNREMAWVRQVLMYAIDAGYIDKNPMRAGKGKALVIPAAERPRERILSRAEEAVLFFWYPSRSRDYFVVALDTGMRRGEERAFTLEHCDFENGVIRLPWEITKTKRARVIPMSARVREILTRLSAKVRRGPLFGELSETVIHKDFIAACCGAKVEELQLRDCRATLTTRLIQNGLSEAEAAQITGHRIDPRTEIAKTLRRHYLRVDEVTMKKAAGILDAL